MSSLKLWPWRPKIMGSSPTTWRKERIWAIKALPHNFGIRFLFWSQSSSSCSLCLCWHSVSFSHVPVYAHNAPNYKKWRDDTVRWYPSSISLRLSLCRRILALWLYFRCCWGMTECCGRRRRGIYSQTTTHLRYQRWTTFHFSLCVWYCDNIRFVGDMSIYPFFVIYNLKRLHGIKWEAPKWTIRNEHKSSK